MRIFTILFIFALTCLVFADSKQPATINTFGSFPAKIQPYRISDLYQQEPLQSLDPLNEYSVHKSQPVRLQKRTEGIFTQVLVDSSRNGFGWLNPGIRTIDRFQGTDALGTDVDFVLLSYRQYLLTNTASGIIGATTIDVSGGLAAAGNEDRFRHTNLNQDLSGNTIGGRYPGVVAMDRPFIHFNQYVEGDANVNPAISHPYLLTDYGTYGQLGGAWTPSYQMDQGYRHENFEENRLWDGPVSIVKAADGTYHYAGVYRNWTIAGEKQLNEYVILNASTSDPTISWNISTNPTLIDTLDFMLYPVVEMNESGFGACVGIGHAGDHIGDTFYMSDLRLMSMTTNDYGQTWTAPREVSWAELGIPETITADDSIFVPNNPDDPNDTTYVIYEGDAYIANPNNHSVDVIVDDNNNIYVAFDIVWGPLATENTYYRNADWCGVHVAVSKDGGASYSDRHVAINNGFFVGDESSDEVGDNFFFDSEADISLDEQGNVYVTWLDRPRTGVQVAEKMRYDRTNEEILFKADVFTARSLDGGDTWSWKLNVTETPALDEYELHAVRHAATRNNGTVYFGYALVDPDEPVAQGSPDVYTYRTNQIWVGEAYGYPDSDAVNIDDMKGVAVREYALQQNYPNPFNPVTRIDFTPLESGKATLDVFNVNGQKVARLYNGQVRTAKTYSVDFAANDLAAGVYFYRLKTPNYSEIRKMVLVK